MRKSKKVKNLEEKELKKMKVDKVLTIVLLICVILCLILSIILYLNGIKKTLPIILVFVLGIASAIIIFLLAKDTISMKRSRDRKVAKKINA